jgi:hypothetical protein
MATRAPFLRTRFGGYYHRDIPEEDSELTHVGPGTPGGEYLRTSSGCCRSWNSPRRQWE